jgi:thioredoxin reductase
MYDVIIVGGSNAGLSAALVLGRARRQVLVLDHGQPRNARSEGVHSFFSRDGIAPSELRRTGREQLGPYESVALQTGDVVAARAIAGGFALRLADRTQREAKRLLLATGVADELPAIEGFDACWGRSAFHCPYCHGWEVRDQPLALFGRGAVALDLAQLLLGWSHDLVICSDGPAELTADERATLARHGIGLREEPVVRLEHTNGSLQRIVFGAGEPLARQALFFRPAQRQRSALATQLGCALAVDGPLPHLLAVDALGQTSVPGVYAAGDATSMMQQAIFAAAAGAAAGAAINRELLREDFEKR